MNIKEFLKKIQLEIMCIDAVNWYEKKRWLNMTINEKLEKLAKDMENNAK